MLEFNEELLVFLGLLSVMHLELRLSLFISKRKEDILLLMILMMLLVKSKEEFLIPDQVRLVFGLMTVVWHSVWQIPYY